MTFCLALLTSCAEPQERSSSSTARDPRARAQARRRPPTAEEAASPPAPPRTSARREETAREAAAPPRASAQKEQSARETFLAAHGDFVEDVRRYTPMLEVSGLYMPTGELRGEPGHFELQHYKFEGLVPMPVSRDTFLLFGGHAGARIYDFSSHVEGADDDILYNAGLRLGAGRFVNDDFVLQGYWQPSLYSDLDGTLNSRDWKLWYGTGLAVYRARADLFLKGGFILTDSVDTGAVPAAGVSWLIAPGWRFDLLVPRNLELSYAPHASWNLHAGIEFETEEFHLRGPPEEGKRERDVHVRDLRAYLGALYRLGRHASLFARVGSTIGAYYDWSTSGKPDYDGTLEPGIFFQAGAGWSF